MISLVKSLRSGLGIYSPEEAAFYARIPATTMKRWIAENDVIRKAPEEMPITFIDFVQALAIRTIRARHRVSLQKIRAAVEAARERGVTDIFARRHTTYWDGHEIHVQEQDGNFLQLTGRNIDQKSWKPIVELYMRDLTYGEDGLACHYDAFSWKGCEIEIRPAERFGEPMMKSCGYTARVLWEACESEGSVEGAARAFGVTEVEAECAARYYDHLSNKIAA